MELEGEDFKADSWSMAVDMDYLHAHCKNVIKRQDVIYGEDLSLRPSADEQRDHNAILCLHPELIQTEVHHMRTLRIMERVFRQGLLEELQLDPSTLHALFPCLDQLISIHSHFLVQLLMRRNASLQPESDCNFTIHRLGDILLEQVSTVHFFYQVFYAYSSHSGVPRFGKNGSL